MAPSIRRLFLSFYRKAPSVIQSRPTIYTRLNSFMSDLESEDTPFLGRHSTDHNLDPPIEKRGLMTSNSPSVLKKICCCLCDTLQPSWLKSNDVLPNKTYPTSWLDGIRGFAALFVFLFHFEFAYHNRPQIGFGAGGAEAGNYWFFQLPIIKLFLAGPAMVSIFFVVSGYTLSYKPLKLIRSGSWEQLLQTMASAIIRRWIRLFIPCLISTFIVFNAICLGLYDHSIKVTYDPVILPGWREEQAPVLPTWKEQFSHYSANTKEWTSSYTFFHLNPVYDQHVWTIPIEFRCSIILFVVLVGLARIKVCIRFLILLILMWYAVWLNMWESALFFAGMGAAELNLIQNGYIATGSEDYLEKQHPSRPSRWIICYVSPLSFILGCYLASAPEGGIDITPGYIFLSRYIPPTLSEVQRWWNGIGSIIIVWSVGSSTNLQKLFNNAFARYLGKISFALYLVHGPLNHTLGYWLVPKLMDMTGRETLVRYEAAFFLASLIHVPVVFWTADLFCRYVDIPVVNFARWLESKSLANL